MKIHFRFNGEPYDAEGELDLSPDPDWPTATCGECGYWTKYQKGAIEARYESWCRKIDAIQVDKDTPACPSFVRRPEEEESDE